VIIEWLLHHGVEMQQIKPGDQHGGR
jgi:hypothetical protein